MQVGDDRRRRLGLDSLETFEAIPSGTGPEAESLHDLGQGVPNGAVVIDDQDQRRPLGGGGRKGYARLHADNIAPAAA